MPSLHPSYLTDELAVVRVAGHAHLVEVAVQRKVAERLPRRLVRVDLGLGSVHRNPA